MRHLLPAATTAEQCRKARLDCRRAPRANARNCGEPTVVCSNLECFERIDMQCIMNGVSELRPYARHRPEQVLRRRLTTKTVKLR